jgi:LCP family protein required for cell wall assembly
MSDGYDATRGHRGRSDCDNASQWATRTQRPSAGAAPSERRGVSELTPNQPHSNGGNHTDGVSVADLFARMGSVPSSAGGTTRHRLDDEPAELPNGAAWQNIVTGRIRGLRRSPIPDFATVRRLKADALLRGETNGATTTLPPAESEVPAGSNHIDDAEADSKPTPRRRRTAVLAGRAAAALTSVFALALTGAAWHWSTSKDNHLNYISALDPNSRDIVDPNAQFGDENFLIVGVDSRYGENANMGAGDTQDAAGERSDTVMLVNIPANRKRVVAVSFPRDLAITPMRCEAWNPQTGKYGPVYNEQTRSYGPRQVYTETKLNSSYAFGGPKCLVKLIQKLSGLSINRFIAIDFAGFSKMVDALGGVRVCSTTPLEDYELGTVLPRAGWQTIDGRTALNYVRARQVTTEVDGDYGRIKRQQLFLSSLLRSLISNDVFFSLGKLNDVVNTFISNSSVDNVQTKDLVDLGQSIQGISAGRVTFLIVPTGVTDSEGNEPLRAEDNRALFDAIINDDPLPGENNQNETTGPSPERTTATRIPLASSSPPTNAAPHDAGALVNAITSEPQTITVHVSNSTKKHGLGASAASELRQHGFNVLTPDDYPSSMSSTTVFFSPGNEQAAATVASAFSNPQIQRVTGMGDVVQVVLGQDFYAVTAPPPSGSSVQVHLTQTTAAAPTPLPQDLTVTNAADVSCA